MRNIKTISINNAQVANYRTVANVSSSINSIDINQATGDFITTIPSNNSVLIYAQSNNSFINSNNLMSNNQYTMTDLGVFGSLNYPLDARFDSIRGKLWIVDNGNNRIARINYSTLVADFIQNINYPISLVININDGSAFIRSFNKLTNMGNITFYSYSGIVNDYLSFNDIVTYSTGRSYLMTFDFKRNRLWFTREYYSYDTLVDMWDLKNHQISELSIINETNMHIRATSIDIDLDSGNAILSGKTNSGSYLFQLFRDNNAVISTTYLPVGS